ncbi:hypothetical protein [Turicibacter sp.]|uniref:hypothetical protein n=1 Tax=Turicibacter sp. TaxID=2049042 RepID=UPI001B4B835A|nr:hypothetical protein [Turicibacter sp.]MBP3903918.1 hypothetical protein [Turicibacter sp.]
MDSETYEFELIGIFYQIKVMRFKQMYDQESWWANSEIEYHVLFQNQKASMPLFILKDCADWEKFKKEANQILFPYHQIESVTTREIYKLF